MFLKLSSHSFALLLFKPACFLRQALPPLPDLILKFTTGSCARVNAPGAVRAALRSSPTQRQSVRDRLSARTHRGPLTHARTHARTQAVCVSDRRADRSWLFASNFSVRFCSALSVSSGPPMRGLCSWRLSDLQRGPELRKTRFRTGREYVK